MRDGTVEGELAMQAARTLEELKQQEDGSFMTDFMYNELCQFDLNEAREEGRVEGRGEAFRLIGKLLENNELDTLRRLSSMTKEALKAVYQKYGLQPPQAQ